MDWMAVAAPICGILGLGGLFLVGHIMERRSIMERLKNPIKPTLSSYSRADFLKDIESDVPIETILEKCKRFGVPRNENGPYVTDSPVTSAKGKDGSVEPVIRDGEKAYFLDHELQRVNGCLICNCGLLIQSWIDLDKMIIARCPMPKPKEEKKPPLIIDQNVLSVDWNNPNYGWIITKGWSDVWTNSKDPS